MTYIISMYHSILILGVNELGPVNEIEIIYINFSILFSLFVNLTIIGDILTIVMDLN